MAHPRLSWVASAVVVVFCLLRVAESAKLKCVQCGMGQNLDPSKPDASLDVGAMLYCPAELPQATECATEHFKYCVKLSIEGKEFRRCGVVKEEGCKNDVCVYSCDTDGCNGAEKTVFARSNALLLLTLALALGWFLALA